MKKIDYNLLAAELVGEIRGEKSQEFFNKRLKFNSNQFSKWETGILAIKWVDFIVLCSAAKKDLKTAMSNSFAYRGSIDDEKKILELLISGRSSGELSSILGRSSDQIRRWRRNPKGIRLHIVLEFIDKLQLGLLSIFLSYFIKSSKLEIFLSKYSFEDSERKSAYLDPMISLLPYALELDSYKELKSHDDGVLALKLGISIKDVQSAITKLKELNIIELKNQLYKNSRTNHLDLSHDLEGFRKLMQFHVMRVNERLEDKKNEEIGLAGFFNVFNISEKGFEEVNNLNREYYIKLTSLVQKYQDHGTIVVTALSTIMDASLPKK